MHYISAPTFIKTPFYWKIICLPHPPSNRYFVSKISYCLERVSPLQRVSPGADRNPPPPPPPRTLLARHWTRCLVKIGIFNISIKPLSVVYKLYLRWSNKQMKSNQIKSLFCQFLSPFGCAVLKHIVTNLICGNTHYKIISPLAMTSNSN